MTGLNARDFAARIGVSHGTISNAESDKHEVRKIVLNAWAAATGVPVEWLERGETSGPGDPGPGGATTTPTSGALAQLTRNKRARHSGGHTREYSAAA